MEDKKMEARRAQFAGEAGRLLAADPEWVQIAADFSGAEVPAESRLTERERLLCVLSALLGCQGLGEYRRMLGEALRGGLDPAAVKETVYQATAYLGIGRVRDFLEAANEILAQHGVPLPLPPQETTDAATRFSAAWKSRCSSSARRWPRARRTARPCGGTSTGGWRPTALATTTPAAG